MQLSSPSNESNEDVAVRLGTAEARMSSRERLRLLIWLFFPVGDPAIPILQPLDHIISNHLTSKNTACVTKVVICYFC